MLHRFWGQKYWVDASTPSKEVCGRRPPLFTSDYTLAYKHNDYLHVWIHALRCPKNRSSYIWLATLWKVSFNIVIRPTNYWIISVSYNYRLSLFLAAVVRRLLWFFLLLLNRFRHLFGHYFVDVIHFFNACCFPRKWMLSKLMRLASKHHPYMHRLFYLNQSWCLKTPCA